MPKMERVMQNLFSCIEEKRSHGPIDIQELSARMTLDTIGEIAFCSNLGGLDGSRPMYRLIRSVADIGRERMFNPLRKAQSILFPHSQEIRRQDSEVRALGEEWNRLMAEVCAKNDSPAKLEPLWSGLLKLEDPCTGERLDKESLRCEMATVVCGGMNTTGHQLAWIMALLGTHPHVVAKLFDELVEHDLCRLESKPIISFDDLAELTYLSAVVKEGMRVAAINVMGLPRVVPRDMDILGYHVPKGTLIVCPGIELFSTEADWGDPQTFRPERWLNGEDMSQKYYLPFSVGPRDCPGQRLALFEIRLSIAEIVRRYEFRLEGTYADLKAKAKENTIVVSPDGIWMHFTPKMTYK